MIICFGVSIYVSMIGIYLLSFQIPSLKAYHSPLVIPVLLLSFLNMLAMLVLVLMQNMRDLVDIFRCMFLETSQTHPQIVLCHIEHIGHDTRLNFLC